MSSTTTISARISAFEALARPSSSPAPPPRKPPRSPRLPKPLSPPSSPRTSLIDLQEWVVDDGPSPERAGRTPTQPQFDNVAPLIHLEPSCAPPLPPRKPSNTSLKSTTDHTYPPLKIDVDARSSRHAPASSISSFHSVSLSSDTDPSTPDSVSSHLISTFLIDREPARSEADSVSLDESYEEVSTPSIITPATHRNISLDWEKAIAKRKQLPPKLPQRPSPTTSPSSRSSLKSPPPPPKRQSTSTPASPAFRATASPTANGSLARKPPPPPPSRSSDRSSIQSTYSVSSASHSTTRSLNTTHLKVKRPTPVPPAARVRYDAVFNANVVQQRKAEKQKAKEKPALLSPEQARGTHRRAAGWRGLSVDLTTAGAQDVPVSSQDDEVVGPTDKLEGRFVKPIWRRSRLGRRTLGEIWNECNPDDTGSLTRDQFAKGMWRIDEELRRAQVQALKSTSTGSLGSLRTNGRSTFKPPPVPKLILR